MAGGLVALFDDVAALVKVTAASLDDVAVGAGKASAKALGAVIDDAAVTPQYMDGLSARRELPIVGKIALGSIRNKLLIILPLALLLSQVAPWALTPILMIGGSYLVFEGAEKILEAMGIIKHHEDHPAHTPKDEKKVVAGAIRTDLILSAEIMVISLNEVAHETLLNRALILLTVAIGMTILVYGVVALIVKMDDMGLVLARRDSKPIRSLGYGMVKAMPVVMDILTKVGTVAMLWVGGHIILNGVNSLGWPLPYELVHHAEEAVREAAGPAGGILGWTTNTFFSCVVGLIVGSLIAAVVLWVGKLRKDQKTEA